MIVEHASSTRSGRKQDPLGSGTAFCSIDCLETTELASTTSLYSKSQAVCYHGKSTMRIRSGCPLYAFVRILRADRCFCRLPKKFWKLVHLSRATLPLTGSLETLHIDRSSMRWLQTQRVSCCSPVPGSEGKKLALKELIGKQALVAFFYPKVHLLP